MVFGTAIVELQLVGATASGVVVKTAGEFAEVGLALELILAVGLGDIHFQSIPKADWQKAKLIFGVESGGINVVFLSGDEATQHVVVLIVIAVPIANPSTFDAGGGVGGVPIPIKGGTAQAQHRLFPPARPHAPNLIQYPKIPDREVR